jgi:hypothetical protein
MKGHWGSIAWLVFLFWAWPATFGVTLIIFLPAVILIWIAEKRTRRNRKD